MEVDKRDLIQRIQRLTKKEKVHILNILQTNNINFTLNSNGYFFNLNDVSNDTIVKMEQCLELIEKNRDLITQMDRRREELLTYYKGLIEEKLQLSKDKRRVEYTNKIVLKDSGTNICMRKTQKYKGHMHLQNHRDPDDLIKEYNSESKFNFKKGTPLYRLALILKSSRSKTTGKGCYCDTSSGVDEEAEGGTEAIEIGEDDEIVADADDVGSYHEEFEGEGGFDPPQGAGLVPGMGIAQSNLRSDIEEEIEEELEEELEEEIEELEEIVEGVVDADEEEGEVDSEESVEFIEQVPTEETNVNERQYSYFKEMLAKKGYKFSYNDLVFQDYIE